MPKGSEYRRELADKTAREQKDAQVKDAQANQTPSTGKHAAK